MHILMWNSSYKASRRTCARPPVYVFNLKRDYEISAEIDIFNNFSALWFGSVY